MKLPNIEIVSAKVHADWMKTKRAQGVESRKSEDGEELMVPYHRLSEKSKDLDRGTVKAVYAAIEASKDAEGIMHVNALMSDGPKPQVLDDFARKVGYDNYQAYDEARDTANGK